MAPKTTSRTGRGRGRQGRGDDGGFTLLELLVVVTVLGLLLGLAVPRLRGSYEAARFSSARETVIQTAKVARARALASGEVTALAWDPIDAVIRVGPAGSDEPEEEYARKVPTGYSFRWSSRSIRFYPGGTADDAWIEIANSSGMIARVEIDEHTGQASARP